MERKMEFFILGNGVSDVSREEHGDYMKVEKFAKTSNPTISSSQSTPVFEVAA